MNASPNNEGQTSSDREPTKPQASARETCRVRHSAPILDLMPRALGGIALAAAMLIAPATAGNEPEAPAKADAAAPAASAQETGEAGPAPKKAVASKPAKTSVGTIIDAFSDLNTVASDADAVFVFVPAKKDGATAPPSKAMKEAAQTIRSQAGMECSFFTLKAGTPDHDEIARQMALPGVLAMVKGRGMSAVSGEITESKLIHSFLSASGGGGCGSSCGPGAAGCR